MSFSYSYARPAFSADVVAIAWQQGGLRVLLIQRKADPFAGKYALPGGFVNDSEDVTAAARRELEEETSLRSVAHLEQLGTYGALGRDPRGWVVSVAHLALIAPADQAVKAGDDATEAEWFDVNALPELAFDHADMVQVGMRQLRLLAAISSAAFKLLPPTFTLDEGVRLLAALEGEGEDAHSRLRARLARARVLRPQANSPRHRQRYFLDELALRERIASGLTLVPISV